jgi:hypothetical protein
VSSGERPGEDRFTAPLATASTGELHGSTRLDHPARAAGVQVGDPMSVLMVLRVSGDPKAVEAYDAAAIRGVSDRGRAAGATKHRFFTNGSEVVVVDEWPDRESFQRFFDAETEIAQIMASAGVTSQPSVEFFERMDVDDAIDWD